MKWDAKRVRALRLKIGLTQAEFAGRLGVPKETVERWEMGRHAPRGLSVEALEKLERIAGTIEVPPRPDGRCGPFSPGVKKRRKAKGK